MPELGTPPRPSVFNRSIEQVARARLALPVVLALAALGMFVNEATYQHTMTTLRGGIALTDARLEAANALRVVGELEAAARSYATSRQPSDRERYEKAARELPQAQDKALALVAQLDGENSISVTQVRALIDEHVSRMRALAESGRGAGNDPPGRERSAELARELDAVLARATALQQVARVSLYDAFLLSRVAVHGLIVLAVLALVLFARQLRRADAQQAREHERLESLIHERTAELRDLAGHLVGAREDERRRVARELHDEMGGLLTAMKLELARLRRVPGLPTGALDRVAGIEKRLNDGIAVKRRIIEHLRPSSLDQLGLDTALRMLCGDTAAVAGIPVQAQLQPVTVDKDAELALYRIVQESLTNVLKYAQAREVRVRLEPLPAGGARLTVRDDGRGFETRRIAPGRHGILGMRLRIEAHGGTLAVRSAPGAGTEVIAELPYRPPPADAADRTTAALDAAAPIPDAAPDTVDPRISRPSPTTATAANDDDAGHGYRSS